MNDETIIIIPAEERELVIPSEQREIEIPSEQRIIYVDKEGFMFSKQHTLGNVIRWKVNYTRWLDKAANIVSAQVSSSSATCTVSGMAVQGDDIIFYLNGGAANETLTVALVMNDNNGNKKNDAIKFTVVPA
jgi:hypothetical protein